ncbi:MAG: hypothetical protein Kilf2KO_23820 [Rhodospirillales bacterium]
MCELTSDPTIQAPSGPAEDATGEWWVSLSEIDALGQKAARGAGFSWGLAEEAGRAARWLAACGQPGPEALLETLRRVDGETASHAPLLEGALWKAESGWLCPIAAGAALSDRAQEIASGRAYRLARVMTPLLLVPLLWRAARDLDCRFKLEGPGLAVIALPDGVATRDWDRLRAPEASDLTVARGEEAPVPTTVAGPGPWRTSVDTWRALDRFAHRTYAPATEASRAGAGAGLRDID